MIASFRDPSGRVFLYQDRIIRTINQKGQEDFKNALNSRVLSEYLEAGKLVKTSELNNSEQDFLAAEFERTFDIPKNEVSLAVEHEKIFFQSYPYEWTPEMLYSAALLTLDLQQNLLAEQIGLKDATPYNILFRGTTPVFIDWLSFEKRDALDPTWLAQAQFIRTFLLPLLVNKNFRLELAPIFRVKRDGLEPQDVYEMSGGFKRLFPPFLSLVTIPKWLGKAGSGNSKIYKPHKSDNAEKAAFILNHQLNHLRRLLKKVAPDSSVTSDWAEYIGPNQHFSDEYLRQKDNFVTSVLRENKPKNVLDIGCNTGYFSRIAAQSGASVVSIDQDSTVVGKVWRLAKEENLDILPLAVDITRPSPGLGWRNDECSSFLERSKGKFEAVMMLAVLHHMLVTERIPLAEILSLASEITTDVLIIEFVPPSDPMFKTIARGRDHLYQDLTEAKFREACRKEFQIIRSEKLAQSGRQLYLLRK